MNPIPALLEQHWQELLDLRDEYWRYALSTAPADRERLESAVAEIYQLHNLEAPQVVWMNSLLDAKLCVTLCAYISDPNVYYSLTGPFGLPNQGLVMAYTPADEVNHKQRLQNDFPNHYTEAAPKKTVSARIWDTSIQPCIDGGGLYETLHGVVGVVSENPLKIVQSDFGSLPHGARRVSLFGGDTIKEPLPNILDLISGAFFESFGKIIAELDAEGWLNVWHRNDFKHPAWSEFGPKLQNMSHENQLEVLRFLGRITSPKSFGCFNPLRNALSCGRNRALDVLGRGRYSRLQPFDDAVKAGGWWWPFDGVCLAFDNPAELHLDSEKRLHNEHGMAVRFRDEWGFLAVHGHRLKGDNS